MTFFKKNLSFVLLLSAIIAYRLYVLILFGFEYTDSDQTIMWLGTKDFAYGVFHEPYFYGQDYNLMLESFVAIPLFWLSVPLKIALPIATTFFTLLPFLVFSRLAIKNNNKINALIILSILALLPIEYDLLTSLSRGFVTGIAVFSLLFLFVRFKKIENFYRLDFLKMSLLACLAYIATPNSVLLSMPIMVYAFLLNYKSRSFYLYSLIGFSIGLLVYLFFKEFYVIHPNYKLHDYVISFSWENLLKGINKLDLYFRMVTPLFWKQGYLTIVFPILFSVFFWVKNKKELAIVCCLIPFIVLLAMTISKVHDGNDSVFFHISRMYLALPVLLGFLLVNVSQSTNKLIGWIIILPISILMLKSYNLKDSIVSNLNKDHIVVIGNNSLIEKSCIDINIFSKKWNVDLIIFLDHDFNQILNYGCPACIENFPNTVYPKYERRTWRLIEDEKEIYETILIFEKRRDLSKEFNFIYKAKGFKNAYIISKNKYPTSEIFEKLNIEVRTFQ